MNIDLSDGKIPDAPEHSDNLRRQISLANMPLVWSEDITRKWAEILLEAYFGADELARQ